MDLEKLDQVPKLRVTLKAKKTLTNANRALGFKIDLK